MDPITQKTQKRKYVRTSISKLCTKSSDFLSKNTHDENATAEVIQMSKGFHTDLNNKWKELKELNAVIEAGLKSETELNDEYSKQMEYDEKIEDVLRTLSIVVSFEKTRLAPPLTQITMPANANNNPIQDSAKFPKLEVVKFTKDPLYWTPFWDSFQPIHDSSLTKCQKFRHLKQSVLGEAASAIDGFQVNDANYDSAIQVLKNRFGLPHLVRQAYMNALINLNPPGELRSFYDNMETYIRGLESIGEDSATFGPLLVPLLLNKIPNTTRQHMIRNRGNNDWTIDDLRTAILVEVTIIEADGNTEISNNQTQHDTTTEQSESYPSANFQTGATFSARKRPLPCVYCHQTGHFCGLCTSKTNHTERREMLKQQNRCFNCIVKGHSSGTCRNEGRCKSCGNKHHTSICQSFNNANTNQTEPTTNGQYSIATSKDMSKVILMTALAKVQASSKGGPTQQVPIFLDQGAQKTFITRRLARRLNCHIDHQVTLSVSSFGGIVSPTITYDVVRIILETKNHNEHVTLYAIVQEEEICSKLKIGITPSETEKFSHLSNLDLAERLDSEYIQPEILIGGDHFWDIVGDKIIKSKSTGPTAVSSKLGYLLSGPLPVMTTPSADTPQLIIGAFTCSTSNPLDDLYALENVGIPRCEDDQNLQQYQARLSFNDHHYIARLPLLDTTDLPTNFNVAFSDLMRLLHYLRQHPALLAAYVKILKEQESRNFIEDVTKLPESDRSHYLTHHPVEKDSLTTPIRIVYNCSRKKKGNKSLNDCLVKGELTVTDLNGIELRFRIPRHGITGDIEKAFLHIGLHPEDRDYTRFLWPENPNNPNSPLKIYRFCVILFGATSSPFILAATLDAHLRHSAPESVALDVLRNLYVDNLVSGSNDADSLLQYKNTAESILRDGGFNLRGWRSNCELIEPLDAPDEENVLGLLWNTKKDHLRFKPKEDQIKRPTTQRTVLSETNGFFDTMGLTLPVRIRAKLFLQGLWEKKLKWDETISEDLADEWAKIHADICKTYNSYIIPRRFFEFTDDPIYLHTFVDSSQKAYGAVTYIVQGEKSSVVMAKARPCPKKKPKTLAMMELTSNSLGVKLMTYIAEALSSRIIIEEKHLWTDSQIVLHWISSKKHLKRYVQDRVHEIKTANCKLHYIASKRNPADLLTRGEKTIIGNELWERGPDVILILKHQTIEGESEAETDEDDDDHLSIEDTSSDTETTEDEMNGETGNVIKVENYSKLRVLLNVTAYVLRWKSLTILKESKGRLRPEEIHDAESFWIKSIQKEKFSDILDDLKKGTRKESITRQLRLFLDQEIIRCGGRIHKSTLDYDARFPFLLPKDHDFTSLVVKFAHTFAGHQGTEATLTQLRTRYWIPCGRQLVRKVLSKCIYPCQLLQCRPYGLPDPAPLPAFRINETNPFQVTGVDFTGSLLVKLNDSENSPEITAYICLFTCAVTRNLHLELTSSLEEDTFIRAFRRFCSRRSTPNLMVSDNASTFHASANTITQLFNSLKVHEELTLKGCDWKFIPARAPWFGAFWERLIGLTKNCLRKVLGRAHVSYDEMTTLLCEVECILNDRPLTHASGDLDDLEPLTPSQLVYGRRLNGLPFSTTINENDPDFDPTSKDLQKRASRRSALLTHYTQRWRNDYLTALRESHQGLNKKENQETLKPGTVVIIHDDTPRLKWKLGLVTELLRGQDGLVRVARLRTQHCVTTRPINKLYPLESAASDYEPVEAAARATKSKPDKNDDSSDLPTPTRRPRRAAADKAREMFRRLQE